MVKKERRGGAEMKEEFVLSEQRKKIAETSIHKLVKIDYEKLMRWIEEGDKEFIKQENWLLQAYIQEEITWYEMCDKRRKLIGKKLLEEE